MKSLNIKKNDTVKVISGKDEGKTRARFARHPRRYAGCWSSMSA